MKYIKHSFKLLSFIFIFVIFFLLNACQNNNSIEIVLPNLEGKTREEITEIFDKLDVKYIFSFSSSPCYNESYYDQFVAYGSGKKAGDIVEKDEIVRIQTTPLHLNINHLNEVSLDVDYANKSFIDDGIGKVILQRCVDGDTARFIDPYSKTVTESFSVRFLGINTPESTILNEPWGKAASEFTKTRLQNANEIVLEAEGARTETYGRYLAFVWVDGILLNLEIVQEAYSNSTLNASSKYFDIMIKTAFEAKATGRRVHGERDTSYIY